MDNVNNLKSTIKYEIFHVDDNKIPNFDRLRSLATHADVYIKAAKHDSFKNTTEKFQIENAASFALYLINMDKDPNSDYGQNFIREKIREYNKNSSSKVKVLEPQYNFAKGSLNLYIQFDGSTLANPVPYKKITE
ncbi:hypothetical protein ACEN2I_14435 [Flavobacterium sp. W22_SRS_FK3]|uniref:hypothetical protein n=1 Tax=Flavobacterium sp. W22_SRS_FK3 TaxID=3240275 RepID=UPI003F9105E5